MVGEVIQGLIALNVQDYVWERYHATLLTIAIITFSIVFNTVLAVRLPLIEGIVLILHVAGLFAIIIPLWVTAPRGNAHDTLLLFTDNGGWGNKGLAAMIGSTSIVGLLVGYDCSVHMCKLLPPIQGGASSLTKPVHESRRSARRIENYPPSYTLVRRTERTHVLHNGRHIYLLPRRS